MKKLMMILTGLILISSLSGCIMWPYDGPHGGPGPVGGPAPHGMGAPHGGPGGPGMHFHP